MKGDKRFSRVTVRSCRRNVMRNSVSCFSAKLQMKNDERFSLLLQ